MISTGTILDPELLPSEGRRWTAAMTGLLAAMLAFMPAAFGAVEAWSELIVLLAAAVLSVGLAARFALDRQLTLRRTWLYWPLALFVFIVAIQVIPLPTSVVTSLSPSTIGLKQLLLADVGESVRVTTLSFYPLATAHDLRLVLVGVAVFAAAANVMRNSRQIKVLLAVVFVIGCAEAVLALTQIVTGTDKIYWSIATPGTGVTAGSFVNYSHFCQFMNLSLGAGIALLLVRLDEDRRAEYHQAAWRGSIGLALERHGWIIFGIITCILAVLSSMSRNGVVSLVIASVLLGAVFFRRRALTWRGWVLGIIPLGVVATLLVFGFDVLYDRLATLQHSESYQARWALTQDTLRAWAMFPIWGAGLGTHEVIFPKFDSSLIPTLAAHADNDYAQLLEETGVVGAALVLVCVLGVAHLAWRLMVHGRTPISNAAYGLSIGLLAVAIHSLSDFGQRLPANFCLSAAFCGLLVAMSRIEGRTRRKDPSVTTQRQVGPGRRLVGALAVVVALIAGWGWAIADGYAAYLGERWWAAAIAFENRLPQNNASSDDQLHVDLLAAAEAAVQCQPNNVKYRYQLNLYRWRSLSRVIDPETNRIALHPDVIPFVERIADDLTDVRRLCPTYGPPYALEGELRLFVLGEARGRRLLRHAVELASYDPPTCLVAGQLAAQDGDVEAAVRLLNRAVALRPEYYRNVIEIYLSQLHRPELAMGLAGDDFRRLNELAKACAQDPKYEDLAPQLFAEAESRLRQHVDSSQADSQEVAALANLDFERRDFDSAIALYRRALALNYNQVNWRLHLAQALVATDRREEAAHEARICLRIRPRHVGATKLLEELSD